MSTNLQGSAKPQGLALAATIVGSVGIVALLVTWLVNVEMIGAIIALVAGVIGVVLATRAKKQGQNPSLTKAGLVISIISLVVGGLLFLFVALVTVVFLIGFTAGG